VGAAATNCDVIIQGCGEEIPDSDFVAYTVEHDIFQPSMAAITLSNQNDIYSSKIKVGATCEVKVGNPPVSIFKGVVLGLEAIYAGGETTKLLVRAVDKMHKLLQKRSCATFQDKTDQQIIQQVASSAGLTLEWKHDKSITYKHVYQHNLTDLEFIRMRAARIGCHVWCVDTKLFVKQPDLGSSSGVKLSVDKDGNLRKFRPRVSAAQVVKKVTVNGWNPETKEKITGEASAQNSPLGSTNAVSACGDLASDNTFIDDQPCHSKEEADALAKARLTDLNLSFLTGEAECAGDPKIELGKSIEIEANAQSGDDPFNGKYYVMGVTHRHTMPKNKEGGYVTIIKFARDAQKK
jgi:uncharacterized protein